MRYYANNIFSLKINTLLNYWVVARCFVLLFLCTFYAS
ncbi:putative membrane protein [Escherichia coli 1-250-04_S1_C3]|nr:putative membrane protein [Escherichia coli 1-250-04_S1_C3]